MNARQHFIQKNACLSLAQVLAYTAFALFLFSTPLRADDEVAPSQESQIPASTVVDENSGEREAFIDAPRPQSSALAQTLYAQAVRKELQDGISAALPLYRLVLKQDPTFADLYLKIGLIYLEERKPVEAEAVFTEGIKANPKAGALYAGLASVKQAESKLEDAFDLSQKAERFAPENILAHQVAFETLRDQGKTQQALALVRTLASASLPNATQDDWTRLTRVYTELVCSAGELPRGQIAALILPLYARAFALGAPSSDLLRQRGEFSLFLDKKEEAYGFLEEAVKVGEPSATLFLRVANLAVDLGKREEALHNYEEAYRLEPHFPQLREVLALQYIQAGQDDKAIALLEEGVRESPTQIGLYASLGDLYTQSSQFDKAEFNYRQVLLLGSKDPADFLKLAVTLMREEKLADAAQILQEAGHRFPESARVAFFQGIVQRELKNPIEALACFAQAKILAKGQEDDFINADYYYELSMAQEQAGHPDSSENSLKLGLALEPNNENILNALAYCWAEENRNLPDALKYSQHSLAIAPDRGEFIDTLGWIEYRLGHYEKAAELLQHAATLTQEDPEVLGHLADAYLKLGRMDDAGATLRKIVGKDPNNLIARKKLENFLSGQDVVSSKSDAKP